MEIELPNDLIRSLPRVSFALHLVERAQRSHGFFEHECRRHDDEDQHENTHDPFRHVAPNLSYRPG